MDAQRTHEAITSDGVVLRGTVHGEGPPLVFWHGAYGDGDLDCRALLPQLTDRFTCHLPSWRGRGRSDDDPDLSYGRRVEDVVDYVGSLGAPAGLAGWSGGANPALAAAARTRAVNALAVFEPTMGAVMTEQERADFGGAIARLGQLAAEGHFTDGMRAAASYPFNEDEIALVDDSGYFQAAGPYVPNLLNVFRQLPQWDGPTADDPAVLARISAPVLVVHGADTKPFWVRGAHRVADHVPNGRLQVIPSVGHAAPLTHPQVLARVFADFLSTATPT